MNTLFGKIMRIIAIILMGLTAAINLLGGTGTVCAAFLTEKYESMAAILDYQWAYQLFMIFTVALGIAGVWATILLIRATKKSYRTALIILALGVLLGGIHYFTSMALRGKGAPANMKFYFNVLTLIVFLLLSLPGIRSRVHFSKPDGTENLAGGLTALSAGLLVLTTAQWVGLSHVVGSENWVYVLRDPLIGAGLALLLLAGIRVGLHITQREKAPAERALPTTHAH